MAYGKSEPGRSLSHLWSLGVGQIPFVWVPLMVLSEIQAGIGVDFSGLSERVTGSSL